MATMLSRRALLRGEVTGRTSAIRPPWIAPDVNFTDRCSRCGECISICPESIIQSSDGGFPAVNFSSGECTFCGECVAVCDTGALSLTAFQEGLPPWQLIPSIGEGCLALNHVVCRSCAEQCEQRAIRFRPAPGGISYPEVFSSQCNGCGACVGVCPVKAVSVQNHIDGAADVTKSQLEESA